MVPRGNSVVKLAILTLSPKFHNLNLVKIAVKKLPGDSKNNAETIKLI